MSSQAASDIPGLGLVHLVRKANGIAPFERFINSYRSFQAGTEHQLILLLKGFDADSEIEPYRDVASGLEYSELRVSDEGVDITAYQKAAKALRHERLCFVNSFTRVVVDDWLKFLDDALAQPGIGIAGASGIWGGHHNHARMLLGLPTKLANSSEVAEMTQWGQETSEPDAPRALATPFQTATGILRDLLLFPAFPSAFIRSNGFVIQRTMMLKLSNRPVVSKQQAYLFESGRRSLTARVRKLGLDPVLVTRDGSVLRSDAWASVDTFWQGDQSQILLADNQTDIYDSGGNARRKLLARQAWGGQSRPALTQEI